MAYCICNVQKCKAADMIGKQREANREYKDTGKYNGLVDPERSPYNLYIKRSSEWLREAQARIERAGIRKSRKDAVVGLSLIFDASPEFYETAEPETILDYFRACARYAGATYGEIVSAVIHTDEAHPHLHVMCVPIVRDPDGRARLSAKDIVGNRAKMSRMQDDFAEEIGRKFGLVRGEKRINDREKKRRLTELDYQARKAEEKLQEIRETLKDFEALEKAERSQERLERLETFCKYIKLSGAGNAFEEFERREKQQSLYTDRERG